ncbi:MAG: enoyl-CoA hydratase [Gammaproteobacteria bacterium]|nr:enoyl-CoA hydratase [Gammaproteobacteria bacterium]MDP2141957.1 enoyl-CoA hydratase [Gammaproteobacteria bacterium]MDP2347161.1 enoyl-CoA hydratase [Gammaproteobacteria bacterium]
MTESCDPNVIYTKDGAVFILQMLRPEKKNALTQTMYRALAEGVRYADADETVNVILIRGTDDCFTSGNDVNDFVAASDRGTERPSVQYMKAISHARKPLVAAVNGLAIGIGTTMLLHCDLVYTADDAWLQLPFTRLGLCPEAGSSYLTPALMGHQRAAELLLLGERFTAAKAREYGLVNEVLPSGNVLAHAMQKARELAALPSEAVQTSKHLLKRGQQSVIDETISLELVNFARLLHSPEAQTIMQAFLNRKKG